jgi:DNA mismatch repair protein MutS
VMVFLHKVRAGAADRCYGIQVAMLAGLPAAVVERAGEVLRVLERADRQGRDGEAGLDDLPLFAATRPKSMPAGSAAPSSADRALDKLRPDELTPKAALDALYTLKALRDGSKSD